jgi:hypothetical protein
MSGMSTPYGRTRIPPGGWEPRQKEKRYTSTSVLPPYLGQLRMRGIRTTCTHDERCGCGLATHFLTAHGKHPRHRVGRWRLCGGWEYMWNVPCRDLKWYNAGAGVQAHEQRWAKYRCPRDRPLYQSSDRHLSIEPSGSGSGSGSGTVHLFRSHQNPLVAWSHGRNHDCSSRTRRFLTSLLPRVFELTQQRTNPGGNRHHSLSSRSTWPGTIWLDHACDQCPLAEQNDGFEGGRLG